MRKPSSTWIIFLLALSSALISIASVRAANHSVPAKPSASTIANDDPAILKTQYPVVDYHGPDVPRTIHFQKAKPESWTDYAQISPKLIGAVIVSEDWAFFHHKGYDMNQIKEAFITDLEKGKFARGASTITQQVAKNVFLNGEKSLVRKAKEFVLSIQIEKKLKKNKILEVYLNVVEWGEGVFGISAASQKYFGKEPSQLGAKESAFLAMLLPSPKRYSQSFRDHQLSSYAKKTTVSILHKMVQGGYLAPEALDAEIDTPLSFEKHLGMEPATAVISNDTSKEPPKDTEN